MSTPTTAPAGTDHPTRPEGLRWPVAAIRLPVPVHEFASQVEQAFARYGPDLITGETTGEHIFLSLPGADCPCGSCVHAVAAQMAHLSGQARYQLVWHMVVCPTCGNKRCPAASHHDLQCTGSNEPDQQTTPKPGRAMPSA